MKHEPSHRPRPPGRWQFSLGHLLLGMMPVAALFAWLGALKSTTPLHLVLCGVLSAGYIAIECFGKHAALANVRWPWRTSYWIARAAFFQSACFFLCVMSFDWQMPPEPTGRPTPKTFEEVLADIIGYWVNLVFPYWVGFTLLACAAWLANVAAAIKIRRARWMLIATTPGGAYSVWLLGNMLLEMLLESIAEGSA
jgi:hypothetical protein